MRLVTIVVVTMLGVAGVCRADVAPVDACEEFSPEGATRAGPPLVHVSPILPRRSVHRRLEGCVVVVFVGKPNGEVGSTPSEVEAVHSVADKRVQKAMEQNAVEAVKRWVFKRDILPVDGTRYFTVVPFRVNS